VNGQWHGVIAVESEVSVDGRLLRSGALTWGTVGPLPLTRDGLVVGTVERMRRVGSELHAEGTIDVEVEVGQPLAAFIDGVMLGNSTAQIMDITRGRLRSVELTSSAPAWDRCRVTRVAY
jgi:hypothetical protein